MRVNPSTFGKGGAKCATKIIIIDLNDYNLFYVFMCLCVYVFMCLCVYVFGSTFSKGGLKVD